MALTETKRRNNNNNYIRKHMTVLGCKVRKDFAEAVKAKAAASGTTVNAVLVQALKDFMER